MTVEDIKHNLREYIRVLQNTRYSTTDFNHKISLSTAETAYQTCLDMLEQLDNVPEDDEEVLCLIEAMKK